jgi:MFS family permease
MKAQHQETKAPLFDVLRNHPKNLLLAIGVGLGAFVAQGTLTTYLVAYSVGAGFSRPEVLNALTLSSLGAVFGILGWSALSDKVGRRPVLLGGAIAMAGFAFVLFPLIDTQETAMLILAVVLGQSVIHAAWYGPLAALCSELFSTGSRYTGASLGYQIAGTGAGFAPLLFASMQKAGGGTMAVSITLAAFCVLTVGCVLALSETRDSSLRSAVAPTDQNNHISA